MFKPYFGLSAHLGDDVISTDWYRGFEGRFPDCVPATRRLLGGREATEAPTKGCSAPVRDPLLQAHGLYQQDKHASDRSAVEPAYLLRRRCNRHGEMRLIRIDDLLCRKSIPSLRTMFGENFALLNATLILEKMSSLMATEEFDPLSWNSILGFQRPHQATLRLLCRNIPGFV